MKPFDEHLTALRAQIMKPHVQYNEETLLEISNLIRTSEVFLKTAQVQKKPGHKIHAPCIWLAIVQEKVEFVEVMEEEWEVVEEDADLEDLNLKSGTQKQIFRKKEQKPWDEELQVVSTLIEALGLEIF